MSEKKRFVVVWEKEIKSNMSGTRPVKAVERLYVPAYQVSDSDPKKNTKPTQLDLF